MAALDFPFSVPREFARFWQPEEAPIFETPVFETMPDLWAAAAGMDWNDFSALRDAFVARYGELKRSCDPPESYSCLHRVNPNMVPMTFRGMQMLHRLWTGNTANPMSVPPLPDRSRPDRSRPDRSRTDEVPDTVLLEVMPGAVLRRMGLPFKGYKNGARAPALRRQILEDLPQKATPVIVSLAADAGAMPGAPRRAGRGGRRHRRRPLGHRPVPFPRSAGRGSHRLRPGSITGRLALCAAGLRKWASFDFLYRTAYG